MFLAGETIILYIAIALVVILLVIYGFIIPRYKYKKVIEKIFSYDGQDFYIKTAKNKNYDFIFENENKIILVKVLYIPSNSCVTINSKNTWKLSWGGSSSNPGRAYPNDRYLKEVSPFINEIIKKEKPVFKLILLYPSTEKILMYLNECELDVIDSTKSPYGYKVCSFARFDEDYQKLVSIK